MGWQPGPGGKGEGPDPGTGLSDPLGPVRDPQSPDSPKTAHGTPPRPSAALAVALETASGAEWRCPSATRDEMLALSMPAVSADKLMWLAWNLQATLPG